MLSRLLHDSPIPRSMVEDSRYGHQIHKDARDEIARERQADRDLAVDFKALAESEDLHLEFGAKGHMGLPVYVALMPRAVFEELAEKRRGPDTTKPLPTWLSFDATSRLPGYTGGHLSYETALEHLLDTQFYTQYAAEQAEKKQKQQLMTQLHGLLLSDAVMPLAMAAESAA